MRITKNISDYAAESMAELKYDDKIRDLRNEEESVKIQDVLLSINNRIEELSKLKDGWDGYGALSIEKDAIDNIKKIAETSNPSDLKKWILFPDIDGSLYMDLKSEKKEAGINLFANKFSYFVEKNQLEGEQNIPFSVCKFIEIMNELGA
jgi:hypothetical protein